MHPQHSFVAMIELFWCGCYKWKIGRMVMAEVVLVCEEHQFKKKIIGARRRALAYLDPKELSYTVHHYTRGGLYIDHEIRKM